MALTRITKGVIKPNENYDTHNINSTGIVTAIGLDVNGNADISGSLSVGGVLTYEDVTSIDSVGIITARTGLVSPYADIDDFVSIGNNIHLGNAGVVTATSFVGDGSGLIGVASTDNIVTGTAATFNTYPVDINAGMTVAGVSTFTGNIFATGTFKFSKNVSESFEFDSGGNLLLNTVTPRIQLNDINSENDYQIMNGDGTFVIRDLDRSVSFYSVSSAGQQTFTGNVVLNNDLDVDGHTNLDNVSIAGVSTFAGTLNASTVSTTALIASGDIDVDGHTNLDNVSIAGVVTATTFSGSGASLTNLNASAIASGTVPTARLGSGTANNTTFLRGDSTFQTVVTDLVNDTSPQLGGNLDVNTKNIVFGDSAGATDDRLTFGAGTDLSIYHQDSNNTSYLLNTSTDLTFMTSGTNVNIKSDTGETLAKFVKDGAVELYHNNVSMLQTESRGVFVKKADGGETFFFVGSTNAGGVRLALDGDSNGDGTGNDYAFLQHNTSGHLIISADNPAGNAELIFCSGNSNSRAKFDSSGHFRPTSNNTYDLGQTALRWRNLYVNDLQLSNEAKKDTGGNDVDGTWGDWTLQEGEHKIFMINNRTGKKYSLKMEEE